MIIGIDANEANVRNRVGISEYAYQLISKFYEFRKEGNIKHNFIVYLKKAPSKNMPDETEWWKYKIVKPAKFWTQFGLPLNLLFSKENLDVFFSTTHYSPRFSKFPTVVSVMDLSYIHYPETFKKNDLYQLKNWTKYSVKRAKKVITISENSKNDIIKLYKVEPEKVVIVPLGLKVVNNMSSKNSLSDYKVNEKFILFVGTLQPRKNIERLMHAFSLLDNKIKDEYQLVVVGKKGWLYEEILDAPKKYKIADKVLFLDYVEDEDLPLFYKKASLFVLPSLYEGFGLPVLEAMSYGCPVITSNVSSLPEAGGDAALYFDPENETDIAKTIEKVISDNALKKKMVEKGREHIKQFTWDKSAKEVLKTLESIH